MKKIFCKHCDNEIFISDDKIKEARDSNSDKIGIVCKSCNKQINIRLVSKSYLNRKDPMASLTVVENVFGYKQKFFLYRGTNTIGRRNKGTVVDVAIITSDQSMDRNHCIISIVEDNAGDVKAFIEDQDSMTGTFLFGDEVRKNEKVLIKDGDVITIGATSLIYTTDID